MAPASIIQDLLPNYDFTWPIICKVLCNDVEIGENDMTMHKLM